MEKEKLDKWRKENTIINESSSQWVKKEGRDHI
jgi:hypothetical protein